jgi:photosystem II stability/assembly factor-like uncharacterized protein
MFKQKDLVIKAAAFLIVLLAVCGWVFGPRIVRAALGDREPVQALAITRDGAIWIGTRRGLYQTTPEGGRRIRVFAGSVRKILIDPGNQAIIHALGEGHTVHQSWDGGRTWMLAANGNMPDAEIRALAYDPSGPTRLVAMVAGHGYYQSENTGRTWRWFGHQDVPGTEAMVINPLDARNVLVGTREGMWHSTNQGVQFEGYATPWSPKGELRDLTVTADRSAILAAAADGLYKTSDGGRSWRPLGQTGLRDVTAVAVEPWRPHIAVAGSSTGELAISRDGGATWQSIR